MEFHLRPCILVLGLHAIFAIASLEAAVVADVNETTVHDNVTHRVKPLVATRLSPNRESFNRKSGFQCGVRNTGRIIGGLGAVERDWCWQAKLRIRRWSYSNVLCGGSIINECYIVTAAHCVYWASAWDVKVYLGAHKREIGDEKFFSKAEKVIVHPKYNSRTHANDIALIKVKKIKFGLGVCPVCLPDERTSIDVGMVVTITGWGNTSPNTSKFPSTLMMAEVNIVSPENCSLAYGQKFQPTQICAAAPGKDSCQGDSGGPMVVKNNGIWTIVGITSYGIGCADPNYPGVYTNVKMFHPWIKKNSIGCGNSGFSQWDIWGF